MTRRFLVLLLLVVPALGCGSETREVVTVPGETHQPSVRDSASVTIVTTPRPRFEGEGSWRIREEPDVVYGYDAEVDQGFGRAGWANVVQDDRIAAIDYTESQIRVFSPEGVVLAMGGPGEGPGEFRQLFQFWRLPGTACSPTTWG